MTTQVLNVTMESVKSRFVDDDTFYKKGKEYWAKVSPTVDGMLGGFSHISSIDIHTSKKFLMPFLFVGIFIIFTMKSIVIVSKILCTRPVFM